MSILVVFLGEICVLVNEASTCEIGWKGRKEYYDIHEFVFDACLRYVYHDYLNYSTHAYILNKSKNKGTSRNDRKVGRKNLLHHSNLLHAYRNSNMNKNTCNSFCRLVLVRAGGV